MSEISTKTLPVRLPHDDTSRLSDVHFHVNLYIQVSWSIAAALHGYGDTECDDNRHVVLDLKSSYKLALLCNEYPMLSTSLVVPANPGTTDV